MRTIAANPSTTKAQTTTVKNYFPKEIRLKHVLDPGGLDIDYDDAQDLFFVYKKDLLLQPGEIKTFEIIMEDVWLIAEEKLSLCHKQTEGIIERLKGTPYLEQATLIAKTIYGRLDEIIKTQTDPNVTKQQHIAYYRDNLKTLEDIQKDIDDLQKILVTAGGPPNLKMIEDSKMDLKSPNAKTTWIIIFSILVFIAILGGAFFFTWQGQVKTTENIFTKEKDLSFSEFKAPEQDSKTDPGGKPW